MLTTLGMLEEPFGSTRLHVARLVASLLYTSSSSHAVIAQELCRLNTMDLLLVRGLFPYFNTERKVGAQWVFFFFLPGFVFQVYVEQLPTPPSRALCCCHRSALCPWNETSAWFGVSGKASPWCLTRWEFEWNPLPTSGQQWQLCV